MYFFTTYLLIKLLYLLRKKNYFVIKNKDCSLILKPLLIESFFGHIQDSLLHAIAIKNFFKKENYKNFITYGEFFIKGESENEILISTYICHPSMCNDNLSGVVVATALAKYLKNLKLKYSIRFLFIPETIGAISWLYLNQNKIHLYTRIFLEQHLPNVRCHKVSNVALHTDYFFNQT